MITFLVTVKTATTTYHYAAIASSSIDAHAAAVDRFGAAAVTIKAGVQHG